MNTQDELISLIFKAGRLLRKNSQNGDNHSSFFQIKVLSFIDGGKNPTMKDVADNFCVTSPSATAVIDRLAELDNIIRIPDVIDRRIVRLALTEKGKAALESGLHDLSKRMEKMLSGLSEKEKLDLITILNKIVENQ